MLLIAMNIVLADAIKGVGFPAIEVGDEAVRGGLAECDEEIGHNDLDAYTWDVEALLKLETQTLEQLYMGLKTHRRAAPIVGAT